MIEMLKIYSKGFLENVTIEKLTPWPFWGAQWFKCDLSMTSSLQENHWSNIPIKLNKACFLCLFK
jgi:hypothetical protein